MIKLLKYLNWKEWIGVFFVLAITVAQVFCSLYLVEFMGNIIGYISAGAEIGNVGLFWNDILYNGGLMLAVVFGALFCTILTSYISSIVGTNWTARVRKNLFTTVNSFSMSEINNFSVASLITRSTNDITQIQQVIMMTLRFALMAPLTAILAITKIVGLSSTLSLVTAIAVVLLLVVVVTIFMLIVPKFKHIQNYTDKLNLVTRENLTGIRVVRANNAENIQENKFGEVNTSLTKTNIFVNKIAALLSPAISIIMSVTALAIVWITAIIIINNGGANLTNDLEVMSKFTQYSMQIIMSFLTLSMLFIMIPRGIVSGKRVSEVLDTKTSVSDGDGVENCQQVGTVVFKNVSFKYPNADQEVLKNISFEAKRGETVAFVGSTGSGKSTLINLIPRFYDCTAGEVLVDGEDVRKYKLQQLNDKLGYIPQKGVLFSGTIEDNVKYGKEDATEEEILQALQVSQSKFVQKLDDGISHEISQGGKNVSGGQKQRLSIARAVVKNPEIYIFDDSFSALDYKTDKALRKALKKHTQDATVLIVAQRIGTVLDADKIIVLEKGQMVGCGTHKELMKNCEIYKEIALSQLSKEEL